jgi:hypothetical protein
MSSKDVKLSSVHTYLGHSLVQTNAEFCPLGAELNKWHGWSATSRATNDAQMMHHNLRQPSALLSLKRHAAELQDFTLSAQHGHKC